MSLLGFLNSAYVEAAVRGSAAAAEAAIRGRASVDAAVEKSSIAVEGIMRNMRDRTMEDLVLVGVAAGVLIGVTLSPFLPDFRLMLTPIWCDLFVGPARRALKYSDSEEGDKGNQKEDSDGTFVWRDPNQACSVELDRIVRIHTIDRNRHMSNASYVYELNYARR
jgi:hypothetical protein